MNDGHRGPSPPVTVRLHPRRAPAHRSVSLKHSPSAWPSNKTAQYPSQAPSPESPAGLASDRANPPSTVSPKPFPNKESSGESSDAGKWFENANNNAVQSNTSFIDNDPPYFLRNSSSSTTPSDARGAPAARVHVSTSMPYRPVLLKYPSGDGSSADDFKGVIDDLTVANKRLKQKLKKYEKLYDAHLQDEKLFEVRFHGLPDHKKKELEEMLTKFAANLDDGSGHHAPVVHNPTTFRVAESGYASLSASGQNSTSAPSGQENDHRAMSKSQYNRQQQSIQSYLHDIPPGLMPRQAAPMTDKTKRKLVVRRLEQVFSGKISVPGNHPQPMQQEEVAQSAAMADRQEQAASGQLMKREGHREARIMSASEEEWYFPYIDQEKGSGSPDQRPTRPLDLDPSRAQVPADNMEYIRHLGFTPPDMVTGDAPEEGHGWIYLNLLINMAQLHTINVTTDFVKDAVGEYSAKLELSPDGRKVRWKGGNGLSRNSSDSSSEHLSELSPSEHVKSPSKRMKIGHPGINEPVNDPEWQARRTARAIKEREQKKFAYTPMFFHKEDSEDDDENYRFDVHSSSLSPPHAPRGDSSGFASSAMPSLTSRRRHDDGPIIFYNKAKFCADLSGNHNGTASAHASSYQSFGAEPLGCTQPPHQSPRCSDARGLRSLLNASPMAIDQKEGEHATSSEDGLGGFSSPTLSIVSSTNSSDIMDFEASGIGGVQPEDNFSIRVKRSHTQIRPSGMIAVSQSVKKPHLYPKKVLEALKEHTSNDGLPPGRRPLIKEKILSICHKVLPNSKLPPASFLPFDSTSSGSVDSDLDSDTSSAADENSMTTSFQHPHFCPQHNVATSSRLSISPVQGSDENSGDHESATDESMDLLASAREADPSAIRKSEREYDAELAERLTEDIPAGSSAATAV
ncbi:hypothetical protein P154DRAFT_530197 [Amniculicola lignicola CBS 123094]|uniref:Frequency clock protein n=1 Tax=Amniculicola lignicola CBS 123094 TaxID=1392246 RepID=A0A6A5WY42_9PLEO|nr:hypothetical protein P154DRAFT_530197 [Amniculicola lignicola CBS 123094]